MTNYYSSEGGEDIPFGDERGSSANPFPFPFASAGGVLVDSDGFPIPAAKVDGAGFPIPLTPATSTSSSSYQVADRNLFSTPTQGKWSEKILETPDTFSLNQDEERSGETGYPNFFKEYEPEEAGNSSDFSRTGDASSKDGRNKRCQAFKTNSAIVVAILMLLVLIISLAITVLFLSGLKVDGIVPVSPAASAPLDTTEPSSSPTLGPTAKVTRFPTSPPTRATPSPVANLDEPIRDFLFQDNGVNVDPTDPMVQNAAEWLVEEANEARSLIFPLDSKYRQRFGILILYYSVNPNVDATISARVRLPSSLMRNQDECSWRGMKCDENGLLTDMKLQNLGLDGTLPSNWAFFPNLKSIDFSKNQLVGGIPEGMYDILGLEELYLYKNRFGGTISSMIGNLWDLRRFHLSHNELSGSIPPELASASNRVRKLRSFNVHRNRMTGSIPSNMNLRQLYSMDLGRNQFSGTVPPDFGTESVRLRHLYLDYNDFVGTFPPEVLNAGDGRLMSLFLNDNQFNGTFPGDHDKTSTMMVELTIQNNNFVTFEGGLCYLDSLSPGGKIVEFKSDCSICHCKFTFLCRRCWEI